MTSFSVFCLLVAASFVFLFSAASAHDNYQVLQASTRHSHLKARSSKFGLCHSKTLQYASDKPNPLDGSPAAMDVYISSKSPFLVLEDNEHLLKSIVCDDSYVYLEMSSVEQLDSASLELANLKGSFVVTSHPGCNKVGERAVFRVADISHSSSTFMTTLLTEKVSWNEAFPSIRIALNTAEETDRISRASHLERRELDLGPEDGIVPADSVPSLPSQNGTDRTSITANLAHTMIDHQFPIIAALPQNQTMPFSLSCKNCTTTGLLKLIRSDFQLRNLSDTLQDWSKNKSSTQVFNTGGLEVQMGGFTAHIELETELATEFAYSLPLFDTLVADYQVPGFGKLAVSFNLTLGMDVKVQDSIGFTYGLDVVVPDNSTVSIDFTNDTASHSTGFENTSVTAIPLQSNVTALNMTWSLITKPAVYVAFDFDESVIESGFVAGAAAGIYLNTPSLTSNFSILSTDVDETCSPNTNMTEDHKAFLATLGNLTHIVPTSELGIGWDLDFFFWAPEDDNTPSKDVFRGNTVLSKSTTLPTSCLYYDQAAKTYAAAASTASAASASSASSASASSASSASASAASASASHNAAAGPVKAPLAGFLTGRDGSILATCTVAMMFVAGMFTVL